MPTQPRVKAPTPAPAKATQTRPARARSRAAAEPAKPNVTIEVSDGSPVRLTNREIIDMERETGMPFTKLQTLQRDELPWAFFVGMAWIVVRRSDPSVTYDEMVDGYVDDDNMLSLASLVEHPTLPPLRGGTG